MGLQTSRHRGGGHKRTYRVIDFLRAKVGVPAKVVSIEYDPNRTARIALLHYADGEKTYILAPGRPDGRPGPGNRPQGGHQGGQQPSHRGHPHRTPTVHNVEIHIGKGGQLVRAAGAVAQVAGRDGEYVQVRLASGEIRAVLGDCRATVGQVGNLEHENISLGKAGRHRWLGYKGFTRGVAKNPCDHPPGRRRGQDQRRPPSRVSPWGLPTRGYKTRNNKRTDRYIVRRRPKKNA